MLQELNDIELSYAVIFMYRLIHPSMSQVTT